MDVERSSGPRGGVIGRRMFIVPAATTVHWHGIRVSPAMDGAPGLSQVPTPSGGSFGYA